MSARRGAARCGATRSAYGGGGQGKQVYVPPQYRATQGKPPSSAELRYEPLGITHFPQVRDASSIYRGAHRTRLGGSRTDKDMEEHLRTCAADWHMVREGKKAGGYYWAVRQSGRLLGIVGLHQNGREGDPYVHRIYLKPAVDHKIHIKVVRDSLRLFAEYNPDELCVWTNSPSATLYSAAGFKNLGTTPIVRKSSDRCTKPMSFLLADLAMFRPISE